MIQEASQLGILNKPDADILNRAEQLRNQVIQVDAFDSLQPTLTATGTVDFDYGHLGAA